MSLLNRVIRLLQNSSCDKATFDLPKGAVEEWNKFFADAIFVPLINIFVNLTVTEDTSYGFRNQCRDCMLSHAGHVLMLIPRHQLLNHNLPSKFLLKDIDSECDYSEKLTVLFNHLSPRIFDARTSVQATAFNLLLCAMRQVADETRLSQDTEDAQNIPHWLNELILESTPVISNVIIDHPDLEVGFGDLVPLPPGNPAFTYATGYFLSWRLILALIEFATPDLKLKFTEYIRQAGWLDVLVPALFHLLNDDFSCPENITEENVSTTEGLRRIANGIYKDLLKQLPALMRLWFNKTEKRVADVIEKVTIEKVSPLLWMDETEVISKSSAADTNMTIRVRTSVREVIATYSFDETSMELILQIPDNFPLGTIKVDSGKRIGVGSGQWRNWMLQLTTFLHHHNGSIIAGLNVWKRNLDKRFQGIEECYICFYVLHGANHQLPKMMCRTCKKKFHSACLFKWFHTSNKSSCPLCRNLF